MVVSSTFKSLWVQEAVREYFIEIDRVPRDEMHAHVLASPSSSEELRKHLAKLNACRDGEAEVFSLAYDDGSQAATMSRSFDWDNDTRRPVLDCAQFLICVVKWDEFHALLFVPRSLLPESVEAKVERNIIKWYVRHVTFWADYDELIQEWLNNLLEAVDSEDLPLCVEGVSGSQVRFVGACLNSVL